MGLKTSQYFFTFVTEKNVKLYKLKSFNTISINKIYLIPSTKLTKK